MKHQELLAARTDWYAAYLAGDTARMAEFEDPSFFVGHRIRHSVTSEATGWYRCRGANGALPDVYRRPGVQIRSFFLRNSGDAQIKAGECWIFTITKQSVFSGACSPP